MIFERYESYKDSGVEWVREIPAEWKTPRAKSLFYEVGDLSKTGTEVLLTVSHITGVTPRSEKNVNMFFAKTMEGYKICKVGDLLINTMWAWMGALGTTKYDGICSPAYGVYRNHKNVEYNHKYYDYLLRTPNFIKEMIKYSKGIASSRLRLYPREFLRIPLLQPNNDTQERIAIYLDQKTKTIDKEIDLLEQKIATYKELKQTLINETVLRGLDKNVKLKESEVEWIGEIPEGWEVLRLKDLGNIETSSVDKKVKEDEELVRIVNYTDVYKSKNKELRNSKEYMIVSANPLQIKSKTLKKGDVLFTPSSETIEDIGMSAVIVENLENTLYSYHILRLRFSKNIHTNFKKYLFNNQAVQYYFSKFAKGTTRKILGLNQFDNLKVTIPPFEEQAKIANYLDEKTNKIDTINETIEQKIATLKEFRKTLINDAVTGKIKVAS